jgi:hypothetical protein
MSEPCFAMTDISSQNPKFALQGYAASRLHGCVASGSSRKQTHIAYPPAQSAPSADQPTLAAAAGVELSRPSYVASEGDRTPWSRRVPVQKNAVYLAKIWNAALPHVFGGCGAEYFCSGNLSP